MNTTGQIQILQPFLSSIKIHDRPILLSRPPNPKSRSHSTEAQMEIYSSISCISSSSSLTSSTSTIDSWIPPSLISPTQVEFWYDDDEDEELLPIAPINFLEECGVCKRGLGTGRDAYICGGEAVFCSDECRSEWMETKELFDEDKRRMMKKIDSTVVGGRRDLQKKTCNSFGSGQAAEICRASTLVAG